MFYRKRYDPMTRAPAERNVSGDGPCDRNQVSFRWSEENLFDGRAFYKHLAPKWGEEQQCSIALAN